MRPHLPGRGDPPAPQEPSLQGLGELSPRAPSPLLSPVERGAINGGMLKREGPIQSPVITIGVEDLGAALRSVEANGGNVAIGKQRVGTIGFAAYVTDTEGNLIGLWRDAKR